MSISCRDMVRLLDGVVAEGRASGVLARGMPSSIILPRGRAENKKTPSHSALPAISALFRAAQLPDAPEKDPKCPFRAIGAVGGFPTAAPLHRLASTRIIPWYSPPPRQRLPGGRPALSP